jgi:ABC-type microcin C transport system permease subunit YejB
METWLMITDEKGKQYPYKLTDKGIRIEDITITDDDYQLDRIQSMMGTYKTLRVGNRIFRTEKLIEISIVQHPVGAS